MGYAPAKRPVKRIKLKTDPKYWVEVYSKLRYKDEKELGLVDGEGAKFVTLAADTALNSLIANWNLDDAEGNLLDINQDTIDALDREDADHILIQIADIIWPTAKKSVEVRESRKKK